MKGTGLMNILKRECVVFSLYAAAVNTLNLLQTGNRDNETPFGIPCVR